MSSASETDLFREAQLEFHRRGFHEYGGRSWHAGPFETCWHCGRQRAVCRAKVRHDTINSAWEQCDDMNRPSDPKTVVPYWCPWSGDSHYHVRTSLGSTDRRRARKRMVKLAMKDRDRWRKD